MNEDRRVCILIVDDDASVRELLKLQLVGEGYEVELADDAIVAGRALMRSPPDLMLVDVAMPYLDGLDFVAALKARAEALVSLLRRAARRACASILGSLRRPT